MFEKLKDAKRLLIEAQLAPIQGDRFQPTGFPDLGAATYRLPDGTRMLLVESAQSVANRLENTIIGTDNELIEELQGLSYIKAHLTGDSNTTTNSLIEAHRINSPFIISDKKFQEAFKEAAGYETNKPIDWQKVATALFKYDINSLLHGMFLANLGDGRIKMPRAVTGFIEASNVREVVSGGVKNNPIDPTGSLRAKNFKNAEVYSNVPYQRTEFTAGRITAFFNIDVGLFNSYSGNNMDVFALLVSLSLYKIRAFLEDGARLRTACDLRSKTALTATEPEDYVIPERDEILNQLQKKIGACKKLFADPPVTEIVTETVVNKKS